MYTLMIKLLLLTSYANYLSHTFNYLTMTIHVVITDNRYADAAATTDDDDAFCFVFFSCANCKFFIEIEISNSVFYYVSYVSTWKLT